MTPVTSLTITNARVFDGARLSEPRSVRVVDGLIAGGADTAAEEVVDANGGALLPGPIDSHVHIDDLQQAAALARWGVTTAFDMGTKDPGLIRTNRDAAGVTSLRTAGSPAGSPAGTHIARLGYPPSIGLRAPRVRRAGWPYGSPKARTTSRCFSRPRPRYSRSLSTSTRVAALVQAAHAAGRLVIAHTTTPDTVQMAVNAGADAVTHTPLAGEFDGPFAQQLLDAGTVTIPTLSMMQAIATNWPFPVRPPGVDFEHAIASVEVLHRAGVQIVAGTDANADPATPARVPHGESLHGELVLMVRAGLSPAEALGAATSAPAAFFGLSDRGAVVSGRRADLLWVDGDATVDIAATRNIRGVWIAGRRVR